LTANDWPKTETINKKTKAHTKEKIGTEHKDDVVKKEDGGWIQKGKYKYEE